MLVIGEESVYLSHLPMFMSPHDYQVILEATFAKQGEDPQARYVTDRRQSGARVYTLPPESFVLPDLVEEGPDGRPRRRSFLGSVFRNHFERANTTPVRLSQGVTVGVKNVIYFQRFDPDARRPTDLTYLLFGKGSELFLAHEINSPPDYDQVLSAAVSGHDFADDMLRTALKIVFPGRANDAEGRLREGERLSGRATLAGNDAPVAVDVQVGKEFYFETGDLREAM